MRSRPKGYAVHALVRRGSEGRLAPAASPVVGDTLDDAHAMPLRFRLRATLVHLVGTPHPNPAKAAEFRRVDLVSIRAATVAAQSAGVHHLVYVSVAHPAPVMREYIAVRQEGEDLVRATGIPATIVRPWYVLGPGHWWPVCVAAVLCPAAATTRYTGKRRAAGPGDTSPDGRRSTRAVETPPTAGVRIVEVPEIRGGE